jgi:hypothetical protein
MQDGIQINRVADRFSSHTLSHSRAAACRASTDVEAVRENLIEATVELLAEGGVPRLGQSRVRP